MLGRSHLLVLFVVFLLLVLAFGCQPAEPEIVEVEVTRIVEVEVEAPAVPAEAAEAPNIFPGMTTEVRRYESEVTGRDYTVFVTLPLTYEMMADQSYPVLYVTDGDFYTIPTAMAAGQVAFGGEMPEVITVGIGYGGSAMETMERRDVDLLEDREAFLQFLQEELIPDIEASYRVDPAVRTLVGHSSGGDFSMYALSHAPGTFTQIIASSPFCGGDCVEEVTVYAAEHGDQPVRLFASTAELDQELLPVFEGLADALQANEYGGLVSELAVLDGETHLSARPRAFVSGLRWIFSGDEG